MECAEYVKNIVQSLRNEFSDIEIPHVESYLELKEFLNDKFNKVDILYSDLVSSVSFKDKNVYFDSDGNVQSVTSSPDYKSEKKKKKGK